MQVWLCYIGAMLYNHHPHLATPHPKNKTKQKTQKAKIFVRKPLKHIFRTKLFTISVYEYHILRCIDRQQMMFYVD